MNKTRTIPILWAIWAISLLGQTPPGNRSAAAAAAPVLPTSSGVSGKVVDGSGKPVAKAVVRLSEAHPAGSGSLPLVREQVRTQADGTFDFPSLAALQYELCVTAESQSFLDPCIWPGKPVTADATRGPATVTIVLTRGVTQVIELQDPSKLLAAGPGAIPDLHILIHRLPLPGFEVRPAGTSSAGRLFDFLAPPGQAINVKVFSNTYSVADGQGNQMTPGTALAAPVSTTGEKIILVLGPTKGH